MRTCYESTTFKRYDGDWVESFFRVTPDHVPGTVFNYDTSASHVLAALVEKLTGMDMLDYLRKRCFAGSDSPRKPIFSRIPMVLARAAAVL